MPIDNLQTTEWKSDNSNWMSRKSSEDISASVGVGVRVQKNAEIRVEYTSDLETGGSMVFVQLVGGAAWQPSGLRR